MPDAIIEALAGLAGPAIGGAADVAAGIGGSAIGGASEILAPALVGAGIGGSAIGGASETLGGAPLGTAGDAASGVGSSTVSGAETAGAAPFGSLTTSPASLTPTPASGVSSPGVTGGATGGSFNLGGLDPSGGVAPAAPGPATAPAGVSAATDLTSGAAKTDPSFLDKIVKGASDQVTKSPLTTAAGLGGAGLLGYNMLSNKGSGVPPVGDTASTINKNAGTLGLQGADLQNYLTSGTLPAGLKTSLDKATQDAKTTAISNAAKAGLPTDPTKNTALASQLASIDQQSAITTAQIGKELFTSGLSETQLSNSLYTTLAGIGQTDQKSTQDALAAFAKALGGLGGGGGINLKLAG